MGERSSLTGPDPSGSPGPWAPDPHLDILLDADRLSALIGLPVRTTRLRPKRGVKHVAALVDRSTGAAVGWVQVLIGPTRVKVEKARMVAAHVGLADQLGERELPSGALLVWGRVDTDPRLARALHGLDLGGATLLRYNPLRRLVLRVGDSVVRVTAEPHRQRWARAVQALTEHGVPVLRPATADQARATGLRPGDRVSVWQWVEGRDLSGGATEGEQRGAGRLLARLHQAPASSVTDLERRGWPEVRSAAECTVMQLEEVAPGLGRAARSVLEELPSSRGEGADVVLHGDFSLDQCLAGTDGRIVLGDLDRLCCGPAEVDLGSLWAVALIERTSVEAVQDAYGAPAPHPVWVAAALLSRVAEPWRAQGEGWEAEVERRTALAAAVLAEGVRQHGPAAVASRAQDGQRAAPARDSWDAVRPTAWRVPSTVQVEGEVVQVRRAWPVGERPRVAVEGPDGEGRLRAATVDLDGKVRLHPPGEDDKLPALADVAVRGRLVVHRAGRRAVVELADRYVKVVRPGRAAGVVEASETGRRLVEAAGLVAPSVLAHDDSVVELAALPGRPVHQLHADPSWPQIWQAWAASWVRLQALGSAAQGAGEGATAGLARHTGVDGETTAGLARHTGADEAQVLRMWAARAAATGMLEGTPWSERLEETARQLEAPGPHRSLPPGSEPGAAPELVVTHRDLHDQQLLWDGTRLGVLDLDTLCLAEPALDPVNLGVHAELRHTQGLWPAEAVTTVVDAVESVLSARSVGQDRRLLAERATVARLAAVYAFRPRWRDRVLTWADERWARLER